MLKEKLTRDKDAKLEWRKSIYHENDDIIISAIFQFNFTKKILISLNLKAKN